MYTEKGNEVVWVLLYPGSCVSAVFECLPHAEWSCVSAVFECLPLAEWREPVLVLADEELDPLLVALGVLPQRPADGFADEELGLVRPSQTERVQQLLISPVLHTQLGRGWEHQNRISTHTICI